MSRSRPFDFSVHGIADVLRRHELVVPLYQREYAWEKPQVERLYQDLAYARDQGEYFLGTIVTIPKQTGALEVVDGQQRLTTTTLLLAAMRDYALTLEGADILVKAIETQHLFTTSRRANDNIPKLRLNVDDNEYFIKLIGRNGPAIAGEPKRVSHERLADAAKLAKAAVRTMVAGQSQARHVDVLNAWLDFLEEDASVILLQAPDGGQAFRMFETLNDRGMKTTQADLVKSYLFGEAGSRIQEAQAKWSAMQASLEEIDDDARTINYLRHFLITSRKFIRANDIFKTVQEPVRGESAALSLLAELDDVARIYVATFRADAEHWNGYPRPALDALRAINRFGISPMRPLVLAIATALSPQEASGALGFLVSFSVRLLIASTTRSGSIEESIATAALGVYKRQITTTAQLKKALVEIVPDDLEFEEAFKTASSNRPEYARYYLRVLERSFSNIEEPWHVENDDPAAITLEHILPKSPGPDWIDWNDPDMVKKYSRRLGNLCLLQRSTNSDQGSDSFESKRESYRDSPYAFTSQVADYPEWSPLEIEERQGKMAKQAVKAWPV
jgi:hypothetical protein